MQDKTNQTNMVADQSGKTKMTAAQSLVLIRALMPIQVNGTVHPVGTEIEVSKEMAKDFCSQIKCHTSHTGEKSNPEYHVKQRAELVKK